MKFRVLSLTILIGILLTVFAGCGLIEPIESTTPANTPPTVTTPVTTPVVTTPVVTTPAVTTPVVTTPVVTTPIATTPVVTTPVVTTPVVTTPAVTTPVVTTPPETTPVATTPVETTPVTTTPVETTPVATTPVETTPVVTTPVETPPAVEVPEYINPLTGLEADHDLSASRPIAISIENAKDAFPHYGLLSADVLYEFLAEYGVTRFLAITYDYADVAIFEPVRSARCYTIDLVQNHDAIFVHAGGSVGVGGAYEEIAARNIDNIDGVNGPANIKYPNLYGRDQERLEAGVDSEHTMYITGENIVKAIELLNIRTTSTAEKTSPFNFVEYDTVNELEEGSSALHIRIKHYGNYQIIDMVYDEETNRYLRYQNKTAKVDDPIPHVDAETGEQLAFENVILLQCATTLRNDGTNHIDIDLVTGADEYGTGYYCYGGKVIEILWQKVTGDDAIRFYNKDYTELEINRGKTYISVFDINYRNFAYSQNYKNSTQVTFNHE